MSRIVPALPAAGYQTYQISAPLATHWQPATCAEVDCPDHLNGWQTVVDETTELGQRQAHAIRRLLGRRFTEEPGGFGIAQVPSAGMTVFTFEAGQKCFRGPHKKRIEREERFFVTGGDWRGNPAGMPRRVHTKPDFWVEDMAGALDGVRRIRERG
jgi:hypothetical protein